MSEMKTLLQRLISEDDGAAASEYAVLVALIVVAVAAAVNLFNLGGIYTAVATRVTNCVNGNCAGTN
jgi:Flp pilus assembly pilin Flp